MPMYVYECEAGHGFEEIQKFADDPISKCECGASAARVLTCSNFALKGEGWHRDGYSKKKPDPAADLMAEPYDDTNFEEVCERTRKVTIKREYGIDV